MATLDADDLLAIRNIVTDELRSRSLVYSVRETFDGANGTNLNTISPSINFSGRTWKKLNGANILLDGAGAALQATDDFTQAGSLYGIPVGSENYILRVTVAGPQTSQFYIPFRINPSNDTYYALYVRQNTTSTFFRFIERRAASDIATIIDADPVPSLVGGTAYTYQIHVTGNVARAVIENFDYDGLQIEMDFNLDKTWAGIGGSRADVPFQLFECFPRPSSLGVNDLTTEIALLQAQVDLMYAIPAKAITENINAIADKVEENVQETVTTAAARSVVPISSVPFQVVRRYDNEIILRRFSSFSYTLNDVGALTGVTKLIFTIKEKKESEADSASVLQIVLTIPAASGTDGVTYVNKGSGSAVRTDGSIAIQEYTENDVAKKRIVIAASDKVTALISKYDNCTFDVKQVISGDSDIIEEGDVKILDVNTRTISS